ncbi:tRNA wybutosine-synthesizing protein 2 [Fulvia fulva]|uniref:tRNA wybutosine-synthesizing protein 2 n=1 Tax=Passalora fulva TaxID=5499 RepID=A0A9Q8PF05_PASFU|nr:tRNA wybutosine-synthesizing protein 2 [Fulvia fulva]KAK4618814.1 tRNA wybutosine-synthesizing protein 2 [Fulvia fulva]UJO21389.1 tRNA wybutosine-synthesizing protein 2 [Fulvia fulva]
MERAVKRWLSTSTDPPSIHPPQDLAQKLNKSYTIYGPMLLLPPTAFSGPGPEWENVNQAFQAHDATITRLYEYICKEVKVTHIALNKPIPLHNTAKEDDLEAKESFNNLRSPHNFHPLFALPGYSFGPSTAHSPPTHEDLTSALWITAKQNSIYQTWSPRWTMFSRGNISEKARLLTLPSVLQAVEEGECTAVDLYAGIGYFAFSYVKAGVGKVLCWDLSTWSCEGLRRGAERNGWKVGMFEGGEEGVVEDGARLVVFNESNEAAPQRVEKMRARLPPVRHVNCGMLPSSRDSLRLAASVLDEGHVGWAHVHENFLVEEIEQKAEETRRELESLLRLQRGGEVSTKVEFINRLKSYAPGVMHCVIDIVVYPRDPS